MTQQRNLTLLLPWCFEGLAMVRIFGLGSVLALLLCVGGGLFGQDKTPTKVKGQLPPNWAKLGLTDEQKQKIYSIQSKYQGDISELDAKIKQLQKTRNTEMATILTDAQKSRLKELASSKLPATDDKTGGAKAGEKKAGDKKDKGPGDK